MSENDPGGSASLWRRVARLLVPLPTRERLRALRDVARRYLVPRRAGERWVSVRFWAVRFGLRAALSLEFSEAAEMLPRPGRSRRNLWALRLPGYRHPVYYREGGSDRTVMEHIYHQKSYECVGAEPGVRYVLDCGANAGYAAHYLLSRYPDARVAVVEPDPDNMRVCRRTLAPFGPRVVFFEAGVWSASVPLKVVRGEYRDGQDWAVQVRPAAPGERADLDGRTIDDLMAAAGFPRLDLLKVDIEAAEAEVFGADCAAWLARVRTLVIELHGPECEAAVARAVSARPHTVANFGELTVYRFSGVEPGGSTNHGPSA